MPEVVAQPGEVLLEDGIVIGEVIGSVPDGAVLREPYCGGASVSIEALRSGRVGAVWLNDADASVRAVWDAVIQAPDALCDALKRIDATEAGFTRLQKELAPRGTLTGAELAAAKILSNAVAHHARGHRSAVSKERLARWVPGLPGLCERVQATQEVLRGRVVGDTCTGLDAVEVIRAPGEAVLFLDPPYSRCGTWMYRHSYREKDFALLAAALRECAHPWIMTLGDDQVTDAMHIPGARIHRVRSRLRWSSPLLQDLPDGRGWGCWITVGTPRRPEN